MSERKKGLNTVKAILSAQGAVEGAVSAAISTEYPLGRPGGFIHFEELLRDAPAWFRGMNGAPIVELQRLSGAELWEEVIKRARISHQALKGDGVIDRMPYSTTSGMGSSIASSTITSFNHVLPMFGVAALMGMDAQKYLKEPDEDHPNWPVVKPAVAAGKDFLYPALSPEIFLTRLKSLFPASSEDVSSPAISFLVRDGAFTDGNVLCPAPGLTRYMLEAFGRELNNGYAAKLIPPAGVDPRT